VAASHRLTSAGYSPRCLARALLAFLSMVKARHLQVEVVAGSYPLRTASPSQGVGLNYQPVVNLSRKTPSQIWRGSAAWSLTVVLPWCNSALRI
jgi:hypothetical protein